MEKTILLLFILMVAFWNLSLAQGSMETPKGKLSGYMFGDYFYNIQHSTKKDLNGVQFRRIYFAYGHAISSAFDTRFRLDADQSSLTSDGKVGAFGKDTYLKWKGIIMESDLIFGFSTTPPYVEVQEDLWGYRSLEKTIMDLRGIVSSRDFGMDLKGKVTGDGGINYWLKLGNNSGDRPESNKFKRYYDQLDIRASSQVRTTAYADFEAEPKRLDSFNG